MSFRAILGMADIDGLLDGLASDDYEEENGGGVRDVRRSGRKSPAVPDATVDSPCAESPEPGP